MLHPEVLIGKIEEGLVTLIRGRRGFRRILLFIWLLVSGIWITDT
jgi:hypothetical protein